MYAHSNLDTIDLSTKTELCRVAVGAEASNLVTRTRAREMREEQEKSNRYMRFAVNVVGVGQMQVIIYMQD